MTTVIIYICDIYPHPQTPLLPYQVINMLSMLRVLVLSTL